MRPKLNIINPIGARSLTCVDAVEQLSGLVRSHHQALAVLDDAVPPAHRGAAFSRSS